MRLTLTNDFHGTSAVVQPRPIWTDRGRRVLGLTHSQVLRARRKLCGIPECLCGGEAGERGGRYWVDSAEFPRDPYAPVKTYVYPVLDGSVGLLNDPHLYDITTVED